MGWGFAANNKEGFDEMAVLFLESVMCFWKVYVCVLTIARLS